MASSSSLPPAQLPKSQYHHFIPRFILRNFVHPPTRSYDASKGSTKAKNRWKKGRRNPNEPMIYAIDLSKEMAEIIEGSVSRTFGLVDMYRDFSNAINQHYLEEELSKLESRAGETVSKIRKSFEEGKPDVWITRSDRNILRKFLFIMKYRSSFMHSRYYHQNAEGYSSDDKERMLQYMQEKGFKKPVDVWFDNIKGMLELKMNLTHKWMEDLSERIYPDDAKMFISHTQMMYLALCTPENQDDEFFLTENAYGIHEGPTSCSINPETSESTLTCYTEFHKFAVISPKLMMVLRSFLLPQPEEDFSEETKEWREHMYWLNISQHNNPETANSILADLPISKARNSYTEIVDGRVVLRPGEDGSEQANDRFGFRFFPISTEHVNKINAIMLEHSYSISTIVFRSHAGIQRALEFYLGMPTRLGMLTAHGFKVCGDAADDPRLLFLRKLERLLSEMGSQTRAVYHIQKHGLNEEMVEMVERFGQFLEKHLPEEPSEFMQLYTKLGNCVAIQKEDFYLLHPGGSPPQIPQDMDQARKMLNLRIKIDVWTQGLNESFREGVRDDLRELFCQLPPRRVWFYLKQVRNMLLRNRYAAPYDKPEMYQAGLQKEESEDRIARGSILLPYIPEIEYASKAD
jgi:hypothetical protein